MFFKRKKKDLQQVFIEDLYKDSLYLHEMIDSYKKDRKLLLSLLRDRVRHTKPDIAYNYTVSSAEFDGLHIYWYWLCGETHIHALYKDHDLPNDIAEDLYRLYRMVWCGDTEVRL